MSDDVEYCPRCKAEVSWSNDRCYKCRYDLGVPNQRGLHHPDEVKALQQRYQAATQKAEKAGLLAQLQSFEQQVKSNSKAVINVSAKMLDDFLSGKQALMSNYNLQTASESRKTAKKYDDLQRCGSEGTLFGKYANEIRYGAISLDRNGLTSYGECCITLSDITMQNSATVMEENSYTFIRKHKLFPGDKIPAGYCSTWANRHLLATAKIVDNIDSGQSFNKLLLSCDGDRQNDEFMEVHIYGAFDNQAIDGIAIPKLKKEKTLAKRIKNHAKNLKISCEKL